MDKSPEAFLRERGETHTVSREIDFNKEGLQGFKFLHIKNIVNKIDPTFWLVKNYFEQNSLGLIFGDPGSYKSFVAIDLACCVAIGKDWNGCKVDQGAVFYIAGEGQNGLARRFRAWQEHHGIDLSNYPLFVSKCSAQLYNAESAELVIATINKLVKEAGLDPKLIIIDTLARNFGGGDENSTSDMNEFVKHVDHIKNYWDAAAIIVHHTGHTDKYRARGAFSLKGALDHEYRIQKDSNDIASFEATKTKEGADPKALNFVLEIVELPFNDEDGNKIKGAVIEASDETAKSNKKLSKQKARAVKILQNCLIDRGKIRKVQKGMKEVKCVTISEFREYLQKANIVVSDKPDSIRRRISTIIDEMNNNYITATYGDYVWLPD